jgi:hypothetical protein
MFRLISSLAESDLRLHFDDTKSMPSLNLYNAVRGLDVSENFQATAVHFFPKRYGHINCSGLLSECCLCP